MNPLWTEAHWQVERSINEFGHPIRLKYYTYSYSGAEYDAGYLTASGNSIWTTGWVQNINQPNDYEFLKQGRILQDDSKIYIAGSINMTPTNGQIKLGVGSPIINEYSILPEGVNVYELGGSAVYVRAYIRVLNGGSFYQEI